MKNYKLNMNSSTYSALAADRKKIVFAGGLILVMVFMWSRVLINKKPANAQAAVEAAVLSQAENDSPKFKVEYLSASAFIGHRDTLAKDFFDGTDFFECKSETEAVSQDQSSTDSAVVSDENMNVGSGEEKLEDVVKKLSLRAVISGVRPAVLINDSIYSLGDLVRVDYKGLVYSLQIRAIRSNRVSLAFEDREMQLCLTQP